MSLKYINNQLLLVAGGFLVVASRAFTSSTASWLGVGIGIFAILLALAALATTRPRLRDIGAPVLTVLGIWTVVSSLVFTGTTLSWLIFANALGLVAIALTELAVHEVTTERVVHTLVVSGNGVSEGAVSERNDRVAS